MAKNQVTLTFAGDYDKLENTFNKVDQGARGLDESVKGSSQRLANAANESSDALDRVGESAGTVDTRAMGFRDSITGVQDTMSGWSMLMKGDIAGGLLTTGAGVGDLASGIENLGAPLAKQVGSWVKGNAKMAASTVASVGRQVASWALLGVQSLLNAAKVAAAWLISIGPLILIGIAVIALVVLIVKNWDTIKEAISKATAFIKRVTVAAWTLIKDRVVGQVRALKAGVTTALNAVRATASRVWNAIKTAARVAWNLVKQFVITPITTAKQKVDSTITGLVLSFRKIPGKLRSALSRVQNVLTSPFRLAFRAIKSLWNSTLGGKGINIPGFGPFGGLSFKIPRLARGGVIAPTQGGSVVNVAEAGETEVVSPLSTLKGLLGGSGRGRQVLEIRAASDAASQFVLTVMREAVQIRGGDLDVVVGTRF